MISLRKINAVLAVIAVVMLACHAILNTLLFFGAVEYSPIFKITGRRLFYPLILHIGLSLFLYVREKLKGLKRYPKLTRESTLQLVSGICMILFAALHILNYSMPYDPSGSHIISHIIVDNLLFVSIGLHLTVSIPRLLVSFGFLEGKNDYKNAKRVIRVLTVIILIIIFIAQATYYGGFIWVK